MMWIEHLQDIRTVAVSGHVRPDGDCVGACIGLWHYIKDNFPHIEADIWLEPSDENFPSLEGSDQIRRTDDQERNYDLFIALD